MLANFPKITTLGITMVNIPQLLPINTTLELSGLKASIRPHT